MRLRTALLATLALAACGPEGRGTAARTLVLVTVDTLRRDAVGAHRGEGASVTPRIDALAREARVHEDARSPVPLTLPAHVTMLSGAPPAATGVRLNAYGRLPSPEERTWPWLPERLRAAGWRTAAFVSATPLARRYGLDQGFDVYDDGGLDDLTGLAYEERPGAETVDRALAHVRGLAGSERLFLWVHLFEPHAPYVRYEDDVAAADAAVGRLLDGLAATGRGEAAVLLTSDHGEALGEHGEATHGLLLGDAVLRVPFLLRAPGLSPGRVAGPVDLADVAPTLAGLAGLPAWPRDGAPGSGLDVGSRPPPGDRIRVAETLFADHRFRWAQLAAAVAPDGGMLVDAGAGRALTLAPSPAGGPQRPATPARPGAGGPLATAIGLYKALERADLIRAGDVPGGYGQAGAASPFLSGEENARRPDPYARIAAARVLDQRVAALRTGAVPPPRVAEALVRMAAEDDGNPEIRFWIGEALRLSGDLAGAEAAYVEAWSRGRRDPGTLVLAAGVNAADREAEMLARLEAFGREVAWDCQAWILKARLLAALGRHEEARLACREAETACRRPRDRAKLDRARTEGTCAAAADPASPAPSGR